MRRKSIAFAIIFLLAPAFLPSCTQGPQPSNPSVKTIVVTYQVLGAVVRDLVGDAANIVVLMPNGADPHEWGPSAKDIETVNRADLIVQNGLGLEGGTLKALQEAARRGVKSCIASDYIRVRKVGAGEGIPSGDADQAIGASDPHMWTDPLAIKAVVAGLAEQLKSDLGINTDKRAADLETRLADLDREISDMVSTIPPDNRKLVTGHESLGYFAQRYGFRLVGAIIPSLTTQASVSAADLASLKKQIEDNHVKAVFTELGTSPAVATAIGRETGAKVIEVTTHSLPTDGSYFTFERNLAKVIVDGLK